MFEIIYIYIYTYTRHEFIRQYQYHLMCELSRNIFGICLSLGVLYQDIYIHELTRRTFMLFQLENIVYELQKNSVSWRCILKEIIYIYITATLVKNNFIVNEKKCVIFLYRHAIISFNSEFADHHLNEKMSKM